MISPKAVQIQNMQSITNTFSSSPSHTFFASF